MCLCSHFFSTTTNHMTMDTNDQVQINISLILKE